MNVKDFSLHHGFLAHTAPASVAVTDGLALTLAVRADALESLDHGTHLTHHGLHTRAIATRACLDCACLAATALASRTDDGLLQGEFGDFALVNVLERDLVDVVNRARFLRAGFAHAASEHIAKGRTAAEELGEKVLGGHTTAAHSTLLKTLLAILIVELSLLGIGEHFIGFGKVLEFFRCVGVVGVLVWVVFKGALFVSRFQLSLRG
jgi:hypothetical protein